MHTHAWAMVNVYAGQSSGDLRLINSSAGSDSIDYYYCFQVQRLTANKHFFDKIVPVGIGSKFTISKLLESTWSTTTEKGNEWTTIYKSQVPGG